jgi:tartrate dehydrogenase/decarboxylase/D-malate dehydrogenase
MLDFFGKPALGAKVITAIETLLLEKKCLTPDLGGTAKTSEIGEAILEILARA